MQKQAPYKLYTKDLWMATRGGLLPGVVSKNKYVIYLQDGSLLKYKGF